MSVRLCRHCGADLFHHPGFYPEDPSVAGCFDCGLAPGDGEAWPTAFDGGEQLRYHLGDWSPGERVALALVLQDVPFGWEPGPAIVVGREGQVVVEDFLAERAAGAGREVAELEAADDGADEEVAAFMGELFVTADRLVHTPWDKALVERMRQLQSLVAASDPPYGVEATTWRSILALAGAVVAAGDVGDDDAVEDRGRRLRSDLRDLV